MKKILLLLLLAFFSANLPAQASKHIVESFHYEPAVVVLTDDTTPIQILDTFTVTGQISSVDYSLYRELDKLFNKRIERSEKGSGVPKHLSLDDSELFSRVIDNPARLPFFTNSTDIRRLLGGFKVGDTTFYIRSGLRWQVKRDTEVTFPYVSRFVGFKVKWHFK